MQTQTKTIPIGLPSKPDSDLLRLYAEQRSEEAFTQLGHRYAGLIYTLCLRELGEPTQAEDAAQSVLLLLSQKAAELSRYQTIVGWLYQTSRHTCRNLRRQQHRRQIAEAKALMPDVTTPAARNDLWERIEPHLHDALGRLKPIDRDAILRRYVQEQSLSEIGVSLGLSENTARMRITRALEKIRTHLARAGVALSLGALAALLEERTAHAAPPSVLAAVARLAVSGVSAPPGASAGGKLLAFSRATPRRPTVGLTALAVPVLLSGSILTYQWMLPQHVGLAEQQRQFAALSGTWQGEITFADDQNGKRYTYPTTVRFVVSDGGQSLQFASTYTGSSRTDTIVFTRDPRTGLFSVTNQGEQISHSLSGVGDLVQTRDGSLAFLGSNAAGTSQIRLQFTPRGSRLTLREEYRPTPSSPFSTAFSRYTFRNQYHLQRAPH